MTAKKSATSRKVKTTAAYRDVKTGRFTTVASVRSIDRNSKKYASVLERLAKR